MTLAHTIAQLRQADPGALAQQDARRPALRRARQFLPQNAVEYFVSYYDYYQPEAYVPSTDVYIEKDASINEDIESLRLRATSSLMEREDVVIVATVSAIYGLGDPVEYRKLMVTRRAGASSAGATTSCASWSGSSTAATTSRSSSGTFRVRGDSIEIFPAYDEQAIRVEMWGDEVERITQDQPAHGRDDRQARAVRHLSGQALRHRAVQRSSARSTLIRAELAERLAELQGRRGSCSRRSGSSRAPTSTSR